MKGKGNHHKKYEVQVFNVTQVKVLSIFVDYILGFKSHFWSEGYSI